MHANAYPVIESTTVVRLSPPPGRRELYYYYSPHPCVYEGQIELDIFSYLSRFRLHRVIGVLDPSVCGCRTTVADGFQETSLGSEEKGGEVGVEVLAILTHEAHELLPLTRDVQVRSRKARSQY